MYLIIIFFLSFYICIYDIGNYKLHKKISVIFVSILLIITAGLSYRVGIDAIGYSEEYIYNPTLKELKLIHFSESLYAPLWIIFVSICRTVSSEFYFLHLIHAIIINVVIVRFLYQNTENNTFTSLLLYFLVTYFFLNFEILRESLSVSIFLLSYNYLKKRKWFKYFLFCLISSLFHTSALITLFVPFLLNITKIKSWIPILLISISFIFFSESIIIVLLEKIPTLSINTSILYKANVYLNSVNQSISITFLFKNVIMPLVLILIDTVLLKRKSYFYPFTKLYLLFGVLSMLIPIIDRFLNYFLIFYILHVSETICYIVIKFIGHKQRIIVLYLFIIIFTLAPLSWFFLSDNRVMSYRNYHRYFPYRSVLNPKKENIRELFYYNGA